MTKCRVAELKGRGCIRINGADAKKFLQDIVTNNVEQAADGNAVHAALLTPQGKILFDFFLIDRGDHFLIECAKNVAADLIKRLTFYKLRADVQFEDVSAEHTVWAAWDGTPNAGNGTIVYPDPRLAAMGVRVITPPDADISGDCEPVSEADYDAHRIALGVPESGKDYPLGDTFPHEADYDQLGGVDFKKGCYVGQEVVGRMQHRGKARKRIVPVRGTASLAPGSEITAGDATIGSIGSVAGDMGLALVRLDRAEKALNEGLMLMAGDAEIHLLKPDWAGFSVPENGGSS